MPMNLTSDPFYETAATYHHNPERLDGGGNSWRAQALEGRVPLHLPGQNGIGHQWNSILQCSFFSSDNMNYLKQLLAFYGFPGVSDDNLRGFMRRAFHVNFGHDHMPEFKAEPLSVEQLNQVTVAMYQREMEAEQRVNQAYNHLTFDGHYALPDRPVLATRNGTRGCMTFDMPFDDEYDRWKANNFYRTWEEVPVSSLNFRTNF